jgi:GT2 family glycosyltransferase
MLSEPLVTVNILSFNRKEELRITLTKVFEQDYKNIEVIVVDNASEDGTQQMVQIDFPAVKLILLKKNIGIAGWNKGFEAAKGEYVLVLDDDCYPEKTAVGNLVDEFENKPKLGALAFNVFNVYPNNKIEIFPGGWVPKTKNDIEDWSLLLGCAFAIRRELFVKDLFVSAYFINFHELPIVLHIFNNGYRIKFSNNLVAHHFNQKEFIYNGQRELIHFRNMLNFIYYHFSKPLSLIMVIRVILFYSTRAIKKKWFIEFVKSIQVLRKPLVEFTDYRLTKKRTKEIIHAEIIEYKFSKKITTLYEKK